VEDRIITPTNSYNATAPLGGPAAWIMQVAAFKATSSGIDVLTHHYDVQRTGWNSQEKILTAKNLGGGAFGLLRSVTLDDEVDAQPLVVTNQQISGVTGTRTVVYVATEGNTVYAIDAATGAVLLHRNLGTPVSETVLGWCNNNTIHIGMN